MLSICAIRSDNYSDEYFIVVIHTRSIVGLQKLQDTM
jgi:hypothetical protein